VIYRLLRAVLRHALAVFFRRIEVEGREQVPAAGPLLLAANHPNTLIDVLLIASRLDRRVGFVAKATLFRGPAGVLLRAFGAVPVARRVDGPVDEATRARNAEALSACEEAVAGGEAVLIFPEGVSQEEPRLQKLKTGVARIALGAEARAPGEVVVVPVALTYDDPETFRSRARVAFGAPIQVAPFARLGGSAPGEDEFVAVRALTEAVREALTGEVVHVAQEAHDALVRRLDALYGRAVQGEVGGRLAATAAIARAVNAYAEEEPERVAEVERALAGYEDALASAGVDDHAVRARSAPRPSLAEDLAFWLSAPLALWGLLNHVVYYQLPRLAVQLIRPDRLYAASLKLVVGLVGLFACYAAQAYGVWRLAGQTPAVAYASTLPLFGLLALVWSEAFLARRRRRRARRRLRALDPAIATDLLARREHLVRELDRVRVAFLARSLEVEPSAPGDGDGADAPW